MITLLFRGRAKHWELRLFNVIYGLREQYFPVLDCHYVQGIRTIVTIITARSGTGCHHAALVGAVRIAVQGKGTGLAIQGMNT